MAASARLWVAALMASEFLSGFSYVFNFRTFGFAVGVFLLVLLIAVPLVVFYAGL